MEEDEEKPVISRKRKKRVVMNEDDEEEVKQEKPSPSKKITQSPLAQKVSQAKMDLFAQKPATLKPPAKDTSKLKKKEMEVSTLPYRKPEEIQKPSSA